MVIRVKLDDNIFLHSDKERQAEKEKTILHANRSIEFMEIEVYGNFWKNFGLQTEHVKAKPDETN